MMGRERIGRAGCGLDNLALLELLGVAGVLRLIAKVLGV